MFKKVNLQTKLFLLLAGLTISVLFVVLIAVNQISSSTIEQKVLLDFRQLQSFFKSQQSLRYDRLSESSLLVAENSTFKGNVETGDPQSVQYVIDQDFSQFVKSDLMIVTDNEGEVMGWLNNPEAIGTDLSGHITISTALRGEYPELEPEWPYLWSLNGDIYQVVSVPIFIGVGFNARIIGTFTLGTMLGNEEARNLKQQSPLDIVLFMDKDIIGSSSEIENQNPYLDIINREESLIDSLVETKQISTPKYYDIGGIEQLSFISPLGIGERAYYMATVPVSREFQALSKIQENIIIIAVISFFLIIPLAIFLGSIISSPIKRLTKAMLKVEEGNLNIRVEPKTRDEIGTLTLAFNKMIVGLRERFALTKYVGDHTLKMIEKTSNKEVALGGTTEEFAILFTDIRGSTSKIETSTADEFISRLNETISSQSAIVLQNNGSIDKFVGDSLIALFSGENGLSDAIRAGIQIQKDFKEDRKVSEFFDGLGVGINQGSMLLGNMGANERMDYTVIGSEVNLCARLCSTAKSGQVLLPKDKIKVHNLDAEFSFRDIEAKELKGFSRKIEVVEVHYE